MKISDVIGIALIAFGVVITAKIVFDLAHRQPSEVQSFTIEEIPSPPHTPPAFPAPETRPL